MISKRDISKLAKKILKHQKGVRDHHIIHPEREWAVGLFGGLILLVVGSSWSFITYQEVRDREVDNVETADLKQTIYRDEIVNTALEELAERQRQYTNMIDQYQASVPVVEEEEPEPEPEEEDNELIATSTEGVGVDSESVKESEETSG